MKITIDEIKKKKPQPQFIYRSSISPWWTEDKKDFEYTEGGLPIDPFGHPLLEVKFSEWMHLIEKVATPDMFIDDPHLVFGLCHAKNFEWLRRQKEFQEHLSYSGIADLISKLEVK